MKIKIKHVFLIALPLLVSSLILTSYRKAEKDEPWRQEQLLAPADLAKDLSSSSAEKQYVYSVGPGATIKGSINIGPAQDKENLDKFRQQLSKLPKDANIVIYCGCCPFVHCPNIRPAFALLNEMKFTNQKLLNLEHNLKTDWIDKGFPVNQ